MAGEYSKDQLLLVIPVKAGIQKKKHWIPGQARNDIKETKGYDEQG